MCKPGCSVDQPVFYGPQDFTIGAIIEVFRHRFEITDADEYVLKFMEQNAEQFPGASFYDYCLKDGLLDKPRNVSAK